MARPVTLGSALADLARTLPDAQLPAALRRRLAAGLDAARAEILADLDARGVLAVAASLGVHRDTLHAWRQPGGWLHVARETFPLELIELDAEVAAAFDAWLSEVSVPDLRALADEEPEDDMIAVERSDGGLWLAGGHSLLWSVYGVPRGRWGWASDGRA